MTIYEEARMKLTNTQIKKLKSAAKLNGGTTLRISKKNFQEDELLHELFLTRNVFANKMSMDVKLSKSRLTKINQSIR